MRILVCGGRHYSNYKKLHDVLLDYIDWDFTIIEGGAKGADQLAALFANHYGTSHLQFRANWKLHGKSAGVIRNKLMLEQGKPDLVIAFPGGKGTAHMKSIAREAGIEVIEIDS